MKTIICPTDFTKPSNNAIRYAIGIAEKLKCKIVLFHAYEIPIVYSDMAVANFYVPPPEIKGAAEKELLHLRESLSKKYPDIKIEAALQPGLVSDKLVHLADEKKADFIIMSSTSTNALERAVAGSNTSRVINDATCPLIVVPPNFRFREIKTITFTTDLKEENLKGAEKVTRIARELGATINFVYVNTHLLDSDEKEIEKMTSKIRDHVKYNKIAGYVCNDTDVEHGIGYFLSKNSADMLCMITHHRGLFEGLWHKSITKQIAGHLTIPLLVLK